MDASDLREALERCRPVVRALRNARRRAVLRAPIAEPDGHLARMSREAPMRYLCCFLDHADHAFAMERFESGSDDEAITTARLLEALLKRKAY